MSESQGPPTLEATIDRSAAKSAKGPRLQRLRACLFLLEAVKSDEHVQAYAAVEAEGDAFVATAGADNCSAYSEEDKNYDSDGSVSFVSAAVINTVVIFVDTWMKWQCADSLRLGFYTTVAVAKESNAGRVKELGLCLPAKPILELLAAADYSDSRLLPCVKALVLAEYAAQYTKSSLPGYGESLKGWLDGDWLRFLSRIRWQFAQGDESSCEKELKAAIKGCRHFRSCHEGKEDLVAAGLLDLFDKKQLANDFSHRFVHGSEVELLFRQVSAGEVHRTDPTWESWSSLPQPADQRSIGEKLTAACPSIAPKTLSRYQRRTADGLVELEEHSQDKNVIAMRYQVYDACEAELSKLARSSKGMSEAEVEAELEKLVALATTRVSSRAQVYGYKFVSESFVRGVVLTLFDSCFLSLGEVEQ